MIKKSIYMNDAKMTWIVKILLVLFTFHLSLTTSFSQGIPFLRNYTANDYHAHSRNFDVEVGEDGFVYIANFEGLMYYDRAEWHIIHTPGITRVTVVYRDNNNEIWAGGYNYFGKIQRKANGEIYLKQIGDPGLFKGEVLEIYENKAGELRFVVNNGYIYQVDGEKVSTKAKKSDGALSIGLSDVIKTDGLEDDSEITVLDDVTQTEPLDNGLKAVVRVGQGLSITDESDHELYTVTEANGLCSNNVIYVAYDGHGQLWGATDDGVFSMTIPSAYSHFTRNEGLTGEVMSINVYNGKKYVGTNHGLFRLEGRTFVQLPGIIYACWDLVVNKAGLLAATANGIYRISADGAIRQLSTTNSMTLLDEGTQFYSGELDGLYLIQIADNSRKKLCSLEKISKIIKDKEGTIWLQNMYGEVWYKKASAQEFSPFHKGKAEETVATVVPLAGQVEIVSAEATKPFPYPLFSFLDDNGITWLTNNESKQLYRWKDGKQMEDNLNQMIYPFRNMAIRAMLIQQDEVWLGSDDGFTIINTKAKDPALDTKPRLFIRSITLGSDSILWSGYGEAPASLQTLGSNDRNLRFTYSLDHGPMVGTTLYRYQLNNGQWSAWADDNDAEFINLPHGSYKFKVQARDAFGRETEVATISFSIDYPFYLRWYMIVLYLILAGILIYLFIQARLRKLEKDKMRLEKVVQERTAEVVKQKDEIEEKSKSLEKALDDLNTAQHELIRQEKMATVGKLTQGLIDRILNPLNYINNFSKLSEGLVKDIEANIDDEQENMDEDNYEDTKDVLDMLRGNLQKVSEHGQNTTRTLKAMEEMLKDRSGGIVSMDLAKLLKQDEEMVHTYFAKEINEHQIKVNFDIPEGELPINGNADQLSKTLMSMLGNSVYAVVKKAQREKYQPEVKLTAKTVGDHIQLSVYDNGIGIEDTIIDKIFDPFFTTKTTGEAAGVGLYLSREIVQNHGGDISAKSVKNEYSEFTITLPQSEK
jgi:signal transduction histidine kinase